MREQVEKAFDKLFGPNGSKRVFFSPGRVNLIGEHIDYNGGLVFPCALSLGNYGAIALRNDRTIRFYSKNFPQEGILTLSLDHLENDPLHGWANYPKGVVKELISRGYPINKGFDVAIYGNLPAASGLSSSASIELLMAVMLNELFALGISKPDLAVLCKKVENEYIGVNCGIMDQFVIANALKDHALLLNCATLEFKQVPLILGDYELIIVNSKVKRGLVDSQYNARRTQCTEALKFFKKHLPIRELCDMTVEEFNDYATYLQDPVLYRRAKHAVTENARTKNALDQLVNQDLEAFGMAMTASHQSLRDDYEVSIPELDALVEIALKNGSIGSRMTGAGFGGCTVHLVPKAQVKRFKEAILTQYKAKFGIDAEIYSATPSDGTKELL